MRSPLEKPRDEYSALDDQWSGMMQAAQMCRSDVLTNECEAVCRSIDAARRHGVPISQFAHTKRGREIVRELQDRGLAESDGHRWYRVGGVWNR